MVHLVWIGGTGVLQSILSSLILKVCHAFAFKLITIKFGEFTNFWMLFQMTCPIFNSIDIECSYQEKICSYPVPCSFRTWPIITNSRGGGVFQAVKKDIIITHRDDLNSDCEIIWTQCQLSGKKSKCILFGSYYRPNASDMKSLEELEASLLKIGDNIHKDNVNIAGDFNAPDIDWQNPDVSNRLIEIIDDHDFS